MAGKDEKKESSLLLSALQNVHEDVKTAMSEGRETQSCVDGLHKDFALHCQKTEMYLQQHAQMLSKHNEILEEHSARSLALQKQNELTEKKLRAEIFGEGLADPDKKKKTLMGRIEDLEVSKNRWKWLAGLIIGVAGLIKALDYIFTIF